MILAIIGAPIVFALSAVPGQENNMGNWFKQMAAYALSIPAIWGVMGVTLSFVFGMLGSVFSAEGGFGNTLLAVAAGPFILIYGFFLATKMPGYVEGWIMGPPQPGRR